MASGNQYSLLRRKSFGSFFRTQFLGAFNDNVFKNALLVMIAFQAADLTSLDSNTLVNVAAGLFILPFFLFSATAGQFADKFEKSRLIRIVKACEILIMTVAAVGFYQRSVPLLLGVLFLMGTQSAFFGPLKYGIIPQLIDEEELVGGNGLVEMGTFLAILLGTAAGGILIGLGADGTTLLAGTIVLVAVLGFWVSRGIPRVSATDPGLRIGWNPVAETWRILSFTRHDRTVFLSIVGISWFWFYGATYLAQLPNYTRVVLHGNEGVVTLLLTLFSVGVGSGSLLCERMSGRKVEIGLVPFGAIGLTLFGIDLYFARPESAHAELMGAGAFLLQPGSWRVVVDLTLMGLFGGFYIVPLYALIQKRSDPGHLSRVIASNNVLNALFMVGSAALAAGSLAAGLTIPQLLLLTAILNGFVAVYIFTLVPEFLMRFIVWLLIHTIYSVRTEGLDRIPERGAAVLVCNHVSFVDALVIAGCVRRRTRFVMYHKIFDLPILRFVFRTANAIPIAGKNEDPELLQRAFDQIDQALRDGRLVCFFPEGRLTPDGNMNEFRAGIERIIARTPVPVIPMALHGLWGSLFSRKPSGRSLRNMPWRLWQRVWLRVGEPVAPEQVSAAALHDSVLMLRGEEG